MTTTFILPASFQVGEFLTSPRLMLRADDDHDAPAAQRTLFDIQETTTPAAGTVGVGN